MQRALSAAQEIGDEKMAIVQTMNDKIELRCRLVNQDLRNLGNFHYIGKKYIF